MIGAVLVVATFALGGGQQTGAAAPPAESIAVNTRGTAHNESTDPSRVRFTFSMYSLATGEQLGTAIDDASCVGSGGAPCTVVDDIVTFHMQGGDIVSHALLSVVPDPQRPGFIMVGSRPSANTIVKATGVYAGRTGTVRLSGTNDVRQFPMVMVQDDFWVIKLS
jgi:hypothetical protein